MLDLGWTNATAAVVHAGRVLFERAVPRAGFRGVHDDWKQRCGVDDSVARWMLEEGRAEHARIAASVAKVIRPFGRTLASELNATCNYARQCWPNARFNTVYLVGGGARDNELAEWLGASLGFQFEQLAIEDTAGRRLGPGFAAAFGLATATTAPAKAAEPLLETGAAA
jgi:Tfp pilus assembly PilM family ATPase